MILNPTAKRSNDEDDEALKETDVIVEVTELISSAHWRKNHPSSSIVGNPFAGITTKKKEKVDYSKMIIDLCSMFAIEPSSIDVTLNDEYWINIIQEELLQFRHNNVWILVPKPEGANIIGEGVDFDEICAPIVRLEAIRLLLRISCIRRIKLYQMDVKSAFLNGYLNKEVYVAQPKGFIDSEFSQHVYKLNKALYGLKADKTLFIHKMDDNLIVEQIYVDDIIFGGFPKDLVDNFTDIMKSEFEMSIVGEVSCFLGLQIKQRSEGIFISQEKYAKNIITKFKLEQSRHKWTSTATHVKITKDTNGTIVEHKLYRSMIASLLYLTASRPDIAVGICACFQSYPRTSHLEVVKRIIKYVHGTSDFGILYSCDTNSLFVGSYDVDWIGSSDDRKSTSRGCFFLENNLISWFSKKQNCVSLFTAEAEYIATGIGCKMVNTQKCTYAAKSSEGILEAQISKKSMHGVRIGGRHFKSTPPQRPYRLPSEKSQAHAFDRLHEPV
ncbi:gag-pol polyprotein [Cucumis melo var. makuwa]|uniref:Gag-pol polyprotein n=1 Tax=Cucumis melo var. makuwa TaxID=1194695 RepID=A0A5D3BVB3_CUCMM|nr:gag-pol polyprotein [Cucumis melo var. makuwa]